MGAHILPMVPLDFLSFNRGHTNMSKACNSVTKIIGRSWYVDIVLLAVLFLGLAFLDNGAARAQSAAAPERVMQPVDWSAARIARQADQVRNPEALNQFRSAVPTGLDSVALPVLVPGTGPVRATPRFRGQETAYTAAYVLRGARLSIFGTVFAIQLSEGSAIVPQIRDTPVGERYTFARSDDGADLDFSRFGAHYTLRLSCERSDDSRCTSETFLQSLADSLIVAGGSPK